MATQQIYTGDYSRLVLAFDVGTRYSSVSYCILHPGRPPKIQQVQSGCPGRFNIPSIVVYRPNGDVHAVGAEAEDEAIKARIENKTLFVAKWFMLHLQPQSLQTQASQHFGAIPPLPPGKTVVRIFADMLGYLFSAVRDHIVQTDEFNDTEICGLDKDIIFSHLNLWQGTQQATMRQAAILAGLIPDTEQGKGRVRFVTEGEADLHYYIMKSPMSFDRVKQGDTVLVVNAGEETIDTSVHRNVSNWLFEQASRPQRHFNGSNFVTQRAKVYPEETLRGSQYHDIIDNIAESFDSTTKMSAQPGCPPYSIMFGSTYDTDSRCNIRAGRLKLDHFQISSFFNPSIECITQSIEASYAVNKTKAVCLVGSFTHSNFVFHSFQHKYPREFPLYLPTNYPGNAVAIGAILLHLHHYAAAGVLKAADSNNAATRTGKGGSIQGNDAQVNSSGATQTRKVLRPQAPLPGTRPSASEVATGQSKDGVGELGGIKYKMWKEPVKILEIPQFGYFTTLDLTEINAILPTLNALIPSQYHPQAHQPSPPRVADNHPIRQPAPAPTRVGESYQYTELTYIPILLKALSKAMMEWPLFCSSITPTATVTVTTTKPGLTVRPHCDISIGVQSLSRLYTPTLQRVNTHSIYSLSSELEHLSYLGRQIPCGFTKAEMPKGGGTITVSNVGDIGDCDFTSPVLVAGGGIAIVAIGRPRWVWGVNKGTGEAEKRFKVGISWSADHRVVESGELAGFVECWKEYVENPLKLIGEGV